MKKLALLVLAGAVLTALPGAAGAAKKAAHQHVQGNIAMQAPPSDATDNPDGCYSGVHRRFNVIGQMQLNGIVGYHFEIDPKTWNHKFRLANETAGADLDITFYSDFGTLEQAAEPSYAPITFGFEERNEEGEFGKVPADVTLAIVCMKTGQNASFTYSAGSAVK